MIFHEKFVLTHQNPLRNLNKARNQKDFEKAEKTENVKQRISAGTMTFFLPFVSAINPQKCEDKIIPIYPTDPINPL